MTTDSQNDRETLIVTPAEVLAFWFGPPPFATRTEWFRKDAVFDQTIRAGFGDIVDHALAAPLGWERDAQERLAELIVLDQFPRNLFREQALAFTGDARARQIAIALVDSGEHLTLAPIQRWFAYLPLEHAEDLALQDRCVEHFAALSAENPGMEGSLDYAERHRDVIRRFGRFPHRNRALGRVNTPEEETYLRQPGSGF